MGTTTLTVTQTPLLLLLLLEAAWSKTRKTTPYPEVWGRAEEGEQRPERPTLWGCSCLTSGPRDVPPMWLVEP